MSNYFDIYLKRLNRYGNNYHTRVQSKRESEFESYLLRSVYRVDFDYDEETHPATFERYKEDESEALYYLLTRANLKIPNGTILMIPNRDDSPCPWMVYRLETTQASGYNRYVMLRMSHFISWKNEKGETFESWSYLYGRQNSLKDDSFTSGTEARYAENTRLYSLIMPLNPSLKKDTYIEVGENELKEAFRVTGYDIQSTPGVEYVSIDPIYIYDSTPAPEPGPGEEGNDDFFWLTGGV